MLDFPSTVRMPVRRVDGTTAPATVRYEQQRGSPPEPYALGIAIDEDIDVLFVDSVWTEIKLAPPLTPFNMRQMRDWARLHGMARAASQMKDWSVLRRIYWALCPKWGGLP